MDYEKKYKEALEIAKNYYKANQIIGESEENDMLYDIFPELKESEDEKIRKTLIGMFSSVGKKDWRGIPTEKIIAWLEKQGESEKQKGETLSGWLVARDEDGKLYEYSVKPERKGDSWVVADSGNIRTMPNKLFPDLKWEDEPIEVDVIFKPKTT